MSDAGRFAPSPTGPLHAGSLVAALASWLDARARGGRWLVRIEDLDTARDAPGAADTILRQLASLGLEADEPPMFQSRHAARYRAAAASLVASGSAYPCGCSRREIDAGDAGDLGHAGEASNTTPRRRGEERVYPGTCRHGLHGRAARTLRAFSDAAHGGGTVEWHDRRLGAMRQDVEHEVGDFVVERADGSAAYQLAVVVDDAAQGITDIVRGEDLASNTARQIVLQRRLGLPTPRYLHVPLVLGADGEKLSKQNGAPALVVETPADALHALSAAAAALGLDAAGLAAAPATTPAAWLAAATSAWRARHPLV